MGVVCAQNIYRSLSFWKQTEIIATQQLAVNLEITWQYFVHKWCMQTDKANQLWQLGMATNRRILSMLVSGLWTITHRDGLIPGGYQRTFAQRTWLAPERETACGIKSEITRVAGLTEGHDFPKQLVSRVIRETRHKKKQSCAQRSSRIKQWSSFISKH